MFVVIRDGTRFVRLNTEEMSLPYTYSGIETVKEGEDHYFLLKKGFVFTEGDSRRKIEVGKYTVKHKDPFTSLEIFVYENDKGYRDFRLYNNVPFIFADNGKAPIVSLDPYIENVHLYLKNGQINTNYDWLLLNEKPYEGEILRDGDKIALLNFVFYYYEDYLYINSFMTENRLQEAKLREQTFRYENIRPKANTGFLPARKELEIKALKKYDPVRVTRQRKMIESLNHLSMEKAQT